MPSGSAARAIGVVAGGLAPADHWAALLETLGAVGIAKLRAAFLRDVLVAAAMNPGASVTLFHAAGEAETMAGLVPPGVALAPVHGDDPGEIIWTAFRRMLASPGVVILLGASYPAISHDALPGVFESLEAGACDVVIGPTDAGGCYLIAARGGDLRLFEGVERGDARVLEEVTERAASAGLRVETFPAQPSLDGLAGLERLARDLASDPQLGAEATRATLTDLVSAGLPVPEVARPWRVEEHEVLYSSPWRTLVNDRLVTHAGEQIEYAYLRTDEAVWVVPVTPAGEILLIRQYRHPIGRFIVEVPAGGGSGDPQEIASRELAEETGGRAGELVHVASYYPASAHTTHRGHVYVALDVEPGSAALESTELLWAFSVPFELALDMARRGEIGDTQSALAILASEPVIRAALRERGIDPE